MDRIAAMEELRCFAHVAFVACEDDSFVHTTSAQRLQPTGNERVKNTAGETCARSNFVAKEWRLAQIHLS